MRRTRRVTGRIGELMALTRAAVSFAETDRAEGEDVRDAYRGPPEPLADLRK